MGLYESFRWLLDQWWLEQDQGRKSELFCFRWLLDQWWLEHPEMPLKQM